MDITIISDYIKRRMAELGYGDAYYTRLRHLVLAAGEVRMIDCGGSIYFLTETTDMVTIQSTFGFFDLSADIANELQYEHQGKITVTNNAAFTKHLLFLQAIPKNK